MHSQDKPIILSGGRNTPALKHYERLGKQRGFLEMQKDLNTELFKKVAEGIKEGGGEKRLIQR